jgi:NTE family protein
MPCCKAFLIFIFIVISGCTYRAEYNEIPNVLPKPSRKLENINVALVLGGGGAKGFVHLGVLEVLEKNKIPIDLIVGTSAGSIVGALYADNPNIDELKKKLFSLTKWDLIDPSLSSSVYGVAQGWNLRSFLAKSLKNTNIEDLSIPFAAVATSLETNRSVVLNTGPIVPAVHASSALPPLFTPVYIYGQHLIDGGATEPVPVVTARRFKPRIVIAVNISSRPEETADYSQVKLLEGYNALGISYRALILAYYELSKLQTKLADISISPDVAIFGMFDDDRKEEMYKKGKEAAEKMLPLIKKKLAK